jgi:hypothetical protein
MPSGLRRFPQSGESLFVTFSCFRRQPSFRSPEVYDLFVRCLENMRRRFSSFRQYALREIGIVEIESEWTARDRERRTEGGTARIFLSPEPALSLWKG